MSSPLTPDQQARPPLVTGGGHGVTVLHLLSHSLNWLADRVVLFRHGNLVFVTFGLFAALGGSISLAWMGVILVGQGLPPKLFLQLVLGGSAAIVVGSWLAGQLLDFHLLMQTPLKALRRPVFVSWGGLLAVCIVLARFAHVYDLGFFLLLDAVARAAPLGHALGRLGCLSYGCCFGRPTGGLLAVTYRNPQAKAVRIGGLRGVPLHPAPFYEALLDLGILLAVNGAAMYGAPVGMPTALALVSYGLGRFAIEFLRNNDGRMVIGALSLNHVISLSLAAVGVIAIPTTAWVASTVPAFSWQAVLADPPWLVPALAPGTFLIFFGFSVHRRRVGVW